MKKEQENLTRSFQEATQAIQDAVARAIENSRDFATDSKEKAEDFIEDATDVIGSKVKQGERLVKKHPVEAVLVGFGLGCLVGVCLARRK